MATTQITAQSPATDYPAYREAQALAVMVAASGDDKDVENFYLDLFNQAMGDYEAQRGTVHPKLSAATDRAIRAGMIERARQDVPQHLI